MLNNSEMGDELPIISGLADEKPHVKRRSNAAIYLKQFLYLLSPRLFVIYVFVVATWLNSILGLNLLFLLIIGMIYDARRRWSRLWILFSVAAIALMAVQIAYLINSVKENSTEEFRAWLGVRDSAGGVVSMFLFLVSMILFGVFVFVTQRWSSCIISDEAFAQLENRFKPLFSHEVKAEKGESPQLFPFISSTETVTEEQKETLKREFEEHKPFYNGKLMINRFLEIYHRHGFELALFFLVVLALYNLNATSLLYVIMASVFSYFSHYFNSTDPRWVRGLNRLKWAWRVLYAFVALDLLRKFFNSFPESWNIPPMFQNASFGCDPQSKGVTSAMSDFSDLSDFEKCVLNYRNWLTIGEFSLGEHIISFVCFYLLVCYDQFFTPLQVESDHNHKPGDSKDFTKHFHRSFGDTAKFFIFTYFYQFVLIIFTLVGLNANSQGTSDLIGFFYLATGIFLLLSNNTVLAKKNRIWIPLELINCLVMIAIVLYQSPWFDCPISVEGRYYFTNEECIALQNQSDEIDNLNKPFQDPGIFKKLYLLIGLNKLHNLRVLGENRIGFIMLFYVLAFIQRKIWNHIYMEAYVEPYLKREQLRQEKRGKLFIENEHVKRISAYKNLILRKQFLKESEDAIDAKIKVWEKLTMNEGDHDLKYKTEEELELLTYEEHPDQHKRAHCLKQLESRIIQREILDFNRIIEIAKKHDYDSKKSYENILAESQKLEEEIRDHLYTIEEIGLPPMRTSTRTAMYEGLKAHVKAAIIKVEEEEKQLKDIEEAQKEEEVAAEEEEKLLDEPQVEEGKEREDRSATDQSFLLPQDRENISFKKRVLHAMQRKIYKAFPYTSKSQEGLDKLPLWYLICYFIVSSWTEITYAVLVLNFIIQPTILSFLLVFGVFAYAAVEYPLPSRRYWKFTSGYIITVLFAKYIYQLPFFCGTSFLSMRTYFGHDSTCPSEAVDPNSFTAELGDAIGIYKFTESSFSVPLPGKINEGMAFGVLYDFITIIVLIIQCMILEKRGIWKHVILTKSMNYVPQFRKGHGSERSAVRPNIFRRTLGSCKNFVYNLLPYNVHLQEKDDYSFIKKPGADFYIPTTLFGTLITIFFLGLFTTITGSGLSITESLNESSFSGGMVITVTLWLLILLADRALYVSREDFTNQEYDRPKELTFSSFFKYSFGLKVVLHYALTITLLVFILVEYLRSNNETSKVYLRLLCVLCAFFLYFSGSQVKWGYPLYHASHSLKSPDLVTGTVYKVTKAIPFLFELGSILDWTFTKTSLDLFQWMKLEDAWSYLYMKTVENNGRKDHKFGNPRGKLEKCYMGCLMVFAIMVILIGPLALFSGLNPNEQLNLVDSGSVTVSLVTGGQNTTSSVFEIFQVKNLDISSVSKTEFKAINKLFPDLASENLPQIQKITLTPYSDTIWDISPPNFNRLVERLKDPNGQFYINIEWNFGRGTTGAGAQTRGSNTIPVSGDLQQNLIDVLESGGTTTFSIPNFFPKFLHLTNVPQTSMFQAKTLQGQNIPVMIDCYLEYRQESGVGYWVIKSYNSTAASDSNLFNEDEDVVFYTFTEPVKGPIFGTNLGDLGVITIYATIVLAIGRVLRSLFDRTSQRVIYEEMPETRDVMELMESIYAARTEGDTRKEQKLYELLIRIYRSPEVIMQLTGRIQKYGGVEEKQALGEIVVSKQEQLSLDD